MAQQSWAPQSPDLSGYAPQSPDLSAFTAGGTTKKEEPTAASWSPNQSHFQHPPPFNLDHHHQQPLRWQQQQHQHQPYASHQPFPNQAYYPPQQSHSPYPIKQEWATSDARSHLADFKSGLTAPVTPAARPRMNTMGIDVKTKFPTSRIKRIMQADEDVGKVAQVTPVVMGKALELFMIRMITASSEIAKSRNAKRVQTAHLKAVVTRDEQFDFLRDIVSKVPDAPTKKGAKESDSEDDDDAAPKKRKKSSAAGRSKKRRGSDDE